MPEASLRFHSAVAAAELRRRLSDPTFVASNIPQVLAVEPTGPTTANWTVEVKLGPMVKKSLYRGELLEASDARVRFRADGPEATIEGALTFAPAEPAGTDVGLTLAMKGNGALRAVVDAYLAKRVKGDAEQFVANLERRLAGPSPAP